MNPEPAPSSLNVPLASLIELGVEHWRLSVWLATQPSKDAAAARHALRRMEDFLKRCELEVRPMDGLPFDAGMAARVIDTVDDPKLPAGKSFVAETLSPLVLWRGNVVRDADIVTRRGTQDGNQTP